MFFREPGFRGDDSRYHRSDRYDDDRRSERGRDMYSRDRDRDPYYRERDGDRPSRPGSRGLFFIFKNHKVLMKNLFWI